MNPGFPQRGKGGGDPLSWQQWLALVILLPTALIVWGGRVIWIDAKPNDVWAGLAALGWLIVGGPVAITLLAMAGLWVAFRLGWEG